jgi:TPR repeat protein
MYLHGLGVQRDTAAAYMWLTLAGNAGKRVLSRLQVPVEKLKAARRRAESWQAEHRNSSGVARVENPAAFLP